MTYKLYSHDICPFAQRTRMVLFYKKIPFEYITVDLSQKPDWFRSLTPYAKVPVLQEGEKILYESNLINEYLDEVHAEPPLFSKDPYEKAKQRIYIDFIENHFIPVFYDLLMATKEDIQMEMSLKFKGCLDHLERALSPGPWLSGKNLSMTDIAVAPWFERLRVLETFRGFTLPEHYEKLRDWWASFSQEDIFKKTRSDPDFFIEGYRHYLNRSTPS